MDVQELKELKDRLYKKYDDPISRDQLQAQIPLKETMMRFANNERSKEEDPWDKKIRQRKLDARAKGILAPYGWGDNWPENTYAVVDRVLKVGADTTIAIRECLKQADSCSALAENLRELRSCVDCREVLDGVLNARLSSPLEDAPQSMPLLLFDIQTYLVVELRSSVS